MQISPQKDKDGPGSASLLGTASIMGMHMVSGPVVGGGLGWLVDHWLDSWPVAAAIGLLLGLAAGFRNVWIDARYLARANAEADAEARAKAVRMGEKASVRTRSSSGERKILVPDGENGNEKTLDQSIVPETLAEEEKELAALIASIQAGTAVPSAAHESCRKDGA